MEIVAANGEVHAPSQARFIAHIRSTPDFVDDDGDHARLVSVLGDRRDAKRYRSLHDDACGCIFFRMHLLPRLESRDFRYADGMGLA